VDITLPTPGSTDTTQPSEETMSRNVLCALALSFAALLPGGCSRNSAAAGDVMLVAPPTDLVGKWRLEVTEGKSSRVSVYHFRMDGRVEVDTRVETPDRKTTDLAKRAVVKVEKDRITVVEISRTGGDGIEDVIPAERRRNQSYQVQVKDGELHWTEVDEAGKPVPQANPVVLKRVED
jgi:hypothetical protein